MKKKKIKKRKLKLRIKTSYYGRVNKVNPQKVVGISASIPEWFKGEIYKELAPPWSIVQELHETGDEERYKTMYKLMVLDNLDPLTTAKKLHGKILLCYEGHDKFCHRRLVAEWLEESLGIKVKEVKG